MRIAAVLRERITAGDLAPGRATPSITRPCADHGVARQTAAHALHVLQDAGLVYRVPGLGYHVCNDILSHLARTANGFIEPVAEFVQGVLGSGAGVEPVITAAGWLLPESVTSR